MNVAVFALLFGVMTAVAAWAWRRVVELRRELRRMERRLELAQIDALNAEARARGVGVRGEHATTIISPILRETRSVMVKREGRRGIPRIVPRIEL